MVEEMKLGIVAQRPFFITPYKTFFADKLPFGLISHFQLTNKEPTAETVGSLNLFNFFLSAVGF